jgi:hypothetical protein
MERKGSTYCLALWLGAFLVAGCHHEQGMEEQARFYQSGQAKPIVAIVPMIDSTKSSLPWNLSEELTSAVHYRLMRKDRLYLVDREKMGILIKRSPSSQSPFGIDLDWIKKTFFENEFVVFMELLSHEELPIQAQDAPSSKDAQLSFSMRLRIIDLRREEPSIVLQEIINSSHHLPTQFSSSHFLQMEWGKENYNTSPLGISHAELSKEIASRIEDYILLSLKNVP